MRPYPAVNWWRGNLRPYESVQSFYTRFCCLNKVSIRQCVACLWPDGRAAVDDEALAYAARVLDEPACVLKTTFTPVPILYGDVDRALPQAKRAMALLRYCPACARLGYHSAVHQLLWLSKCPFHLEELKEGAHTYSEASFPIYSHALEKVMAAACPSWPRAPDNAAHIVGVRLTQLQRWCKVVSDALQLAATEVIWRPDTPNDKPCPTSAILGRLATLVQLPDEIRPMLCAIGRPWTVDSRCLSKRLLRALDKLSPPAGIDSALEYYKMAAMHREQPSGFCRTVQTYRDKVMRMHDPGKCTWGRRGSAWNCRWERIAPGMLDYRNFDCPHEVALQELDMVSGRDDDGVRYRARREERYIAAARIMHDAGLVTWPAGTDRASTYFYGTNLRYLVWHGTAALDALLDTLARCEIDYAGENLIAWLSAIDHGANPAEQQPAAHLEALHRTADGLRLVRWTPPDTPC